MENTAETELTLRDIGRILRRRILFIAGAATILTIAAILVSVFTTRRYEATSTIQVQRESSDGLDLNSLVGGTQATSDALDSDVALQTQALVLQSNTLAMRTIQKLKLADTQDFREHASNKIARAPGEEQAQLPARQAGLLGTFHKNLTVKPVPGTHLITVNYLNPDPKLAAAVVNEVVQELIEENFETRYKATESASQALSKQLADLRVQSENLQAQVAQMQRDSGIYSIGTTDAQGRQQTYSAVLEQFQKAAAILSDASESRIIKQGIYQAAKQGDAELLSSLAGNGASAGAISTSQNTLQLLRAQQATQQAQLDQLKTKFGPGYPRVAELQASVSALGTAIQQETSRIGKRAESDFTVADRTYRNAQDNYNALKVQADALNDKAIRYMITRQESDDSRSLYEDLLKRLKEAGILQGLRSSTITVVDEALVPPSPKKPNIKLYVAAGLLGGLFLGCAGALFADLLDDGVQDANAIEQLGIPLLGILPAFTKRQRERTFLGNPHSPYSDALRNLRAELIRLNGGTAPGIVLLADTTPRVKTNTVALDLAACFAQQRRKVLLVDADMRRPTSVHTGEHSGQPGLSVLLSGDSFANLILVHPKLPQLHILPAGPIPPNSSELLESERMLGLLRTWREMFDMIVIAGPPVIPSADTRSLAEVADVTLQIVAAEKTTKTSLKRAHTVLSAYAKQNAGAVLDSSAGDSTVLDRYYGYHVSNRREKESLSESV